MIYLSIDTLYDIHNQVNVYQSNLAFYIIKKILMRRYLTFFMVLKQTVKIKPVKIFVALKVTGTQWQAHGHP